MKIVFDEDSLQLSSTGSVYGNIWVESAGQAFPSREWSDFPLVVLGWWMNALHDDSVIKELRFMDGPHMIRLSATEDVSTHRAEMITTRARGREVKELECDADIPQLRRELYGYAIAVVKFCERQGFDSPDLERLVECVRLSVKLA